MITYFSIPVLPKFQQDAEHYYRGKETSQEFKDLLEWASTAALTNDSNLYTNHLPFGRVRVGKMHELSFRVPFTYNEADNERVPDVEKANELSGFLQNSKLFNPHAVNNSLTNWLGHYAQSNGKMVILGLETAAKEVTQALSRRGEVTQPLARELLNVHAKSGAFFKLGEDPNSLVANIPGSEVRRAAAVASLKKIPGVAFLHQVVA